MLSLLRDEIEAVQGNGSEYVFPEQAAMYEKNAQGITYRVKRVLEAAGYFDPEEEERKREKRRKKRAEKAGKTLKPRKPALRRPEKPVGEAGAEREVGLRRASVRDFHSFRVTWITLALAAGVPLELVQRVTGHQTTNVVLKHYFRPGREDFKWMIEKAMPKLLTTEPAEEEAEEKSVQEQIDEICAAATARTWKKDMAKIAALVKELEARADGQRRGRSHRDGNEVGR